MQSTMKTMKRLAFIEAFLVAMFLAGYAFAGPAWTSNGTVAAGGGSSSSGGTVGPGTINTVAKFTAATTVGNATNLTDNGTTFDVAENMLIGTTGPTDTSNLEVFSTSTTITTTATYNNGANAAYLAVERSRGTRASPAAVQAGDVLGNLAWAGQFDTTFTHANNGIVIQGVATENWTGAKNGTDMNFQTNATGTSALTTKMTLTNGGNLVINTDGTAGAPVLTMGAAADPDTGIYHPAANELAVAGNGVNAVTFRSNDATHGTHFTGTNGNLNTICLTQTATDICDVSANTGAFMDPSQLTFSTAGTPSTGTIFADPVVLATGNTTLTMASSGATTFAGPTTVVVNNAVSGSNSSVQSNGTVASASPLVPFQIGPTTAFAAANIGMFVCTQRCTITRAWGMALTAGTVGTTAITVTVSDGTNTCTLTSGSGCNSAADTKEAFATSGTCTFAATSSLTVVGNKGNCTVGPSFRNFGIEINNQ